MARPFRFAVQSFNAASGADWASKAQRAESLGYSAFHLADHIIGPGPALSRTNHPIQGLAAVPAMAYAAAVTKSIRIGCRVFCVDYRLPVVLAKEAMTIDLLSNGRLELGLGAGWLKDEYEAVGLTMDTPGTRISRLEDVIRAVKAYCVEDELAVNNESVKWNEFQGLPKPVQTPHPPIMIGGGSKRVLTLAGETADIVSFNFNNRQGVIGPDGVQMSTAAETAKKLDWIKAGAGDRFDQIELEIGAYFTFVTDQPDPIVSMFSQNFGLPEDEMRQHPHALFGGVSAICDELERRREAYGISYIT
ncbi:MAG: TIGR03621 family F420-dependent LLM class oxidoreductase, partial [Pseudomonadales bacterium]